MLTLQFRFGQFDQPGEALAMFCSEILSFEKSPAMLDYSALALNQEGSDAGEPLKYGRLGREPDAGQQVRHDRITKKGRQRDAICVIVRRSHSGE